MSKFIAKWGVLVAFLFIAIGGGYAIQRQLEDRIDAQIQMCERVKHDRVDNARAWTALEKYFDRVANSKNADSAMDDVKRHARVVEDKVSESANQLRTRILQCQPLIEDDEYIIDERLLREALGKL